jgi:ubiquinone/menaquinone biosynthesis C-methylase UbiE
MSFLRVFLEKSVNRKFRKKRFSFFLSLLNGIKSDQPLRILDIGGTESYWESMNFVDNENVHITLLNLKIANVKNKNFTSIKGDASDLSDFKDGHFDIVYSNSVIEHLYNKENQKKMANEVRRTGRYYYVQTPNYYFPIEPHWLFPFFQFLPFRVRVFMTKNLNLGNYERSGNEEVAIDRIKRVSLLTEKEMKALFPDAKVYREKLLGLTKSITLYKFPIS